MNRLLIAGILCVAFVSNVSAAAPAKKAKKKPAVDKGPDIALLFNKLDTNNDKKLSPKEFEAFTGLQEDKAKKAAKAGKAKKPQNVSSNPGEAAKKAKKPGKAAKQAKKSGKAKKNEGAATGAGSMNAQWFKKLDTNNDNFLSLDEFTSIKEVVGMPEQKKAKK